MNKLFASKVCVSNAKSLFFRLIPGVLFLVMVAQMQSTQAGSSDSQEKSMTKISRPTTAVDILRNFKFALDNDLFLQDDFYSNENLERFFAAARISWEDGRRARKTGRVISRDAVEFYLSHGTIDALGNDDDFGRRQGGGVLSGKFTADLVIEVFGTPLRVRNPYVAEDARHPSVLMKSTHKFGNLAIEYKFDRPRSTASIQCTFHGDGTVKECNFGNAEK